eukprot:4696975-Amphidinium_carterae.1
MGKVAQVVSSVQEWAFPIESLRLLVLLGASTNQMPSFIGNCTSVGSTDLMFGILGLCVC